MMKKKMQEIEKALLSWEGIEGRENRCFEKRSAKSNKMLVHLVFQKGRISVGCSFIVYQIGDG